MAAIALAAVHLAAFRFALNGQLSRLHDHRSPGVGYTALHGEGDSAENAKQVWEAGFQALHEFDPAGPVMLVRLLVVVDVAMAIAIAVVALRVLRRGWSRPIALVIVAVYVSARLVTALADLAIVRANVDGRYDALFPWVDRAAVASLAAVGALLAASACGRLPRIWSAYRSAPATARIALAVSTVFAVILHAGQIGAQSEDILRREMALSSGLALVRVFAAVAIYLVVLSIVRAIPARTGTTPSPKHMIAGGAAVVVLGTVLVRVAGGGAAPLVFGTLLLLAGLASLRGGTEPEQTPDGDGRGVYLLAAVVPLAALAALAGRLLAGELATHGRWLPLACLEAAILALAVFVGARFLRPVSTQAVAGPLLTTAVVVQGVGRLRTSFLAAVALFPPIVAVGQRAWDGTSESVGNTLGALALLALAIASVVALSGLIRLLVIAYDRPRVFARFARTPVVALLVAWLVLTVVPGGSVEVAGKSPHVVRFAFADQDWQAGRIPVRSPADCDNKSVLASLGGALAPNQTRIANELCRWLNVNAKHAVGSPRTSVPLVLAAASGGGVRAAAWTARVLDCLFLQRPSTAGADPCGRGRIPTDNLDTWPRLFALGGASGGSVGIMSATAQRIAPMPGTAASRDWVRALSGPDHVAPLISHMLLAEMGLAGVGVVPANDRAEVLIDGWSAPFSAIDALRCPALDERSMDEVGFLELRAGCAQHVPLLLFNGTVVRNGRRFNISPLDGSQTSRQEVDTSWTKRSVDMLDVLCDDQDVRAFDAAFLSARFPFVTPSGRILAASRPCSGRDLPSPVDVVDGGYRENSGAAQIHELLTVLRPLVESYNAGSPKGYRPVRIVFLQIENGEAPGGALGLEPGALSDLPLTGPDDYVEPIRDDDHLGVSVGEPARPVVAGFHIVTKRPRVEAMKALLDVLRECTPTSPAVPVIKMDLQQHPGNALPLGWSLSEPILDDLDAVYRLGPAQQAAAELRALFSGGYGGVLRSCKNSGEGA